MKRDLICVGQAYFDGKMGVREVVDIDHNGCVSYRILAARSENELLERGRVRSVLGSTSSMDLWGFAAWAKDSMSLADGAQLALRLRAGRVKLSPKELAFMQALAPQVSEGMGRFNIVFERHELRVVKGLKAKGIVATLIHSGAGPGEFSLSALGRSWSD